MYSLGSIISVNDFIPMKYKVCTKSSIFIMNWMSNSFHIGGNNILSVTSLEYVAITELVLPFFYFGYIS
jgi:hypothetical protein